MKKMILLTAIISISGIMFVGCGKDTTNETNNMIESDNPLQKGATDEKPTDQKQQAIELEEGSIVVQVTEVNGSEISANIGEFAINEMEEKTEGEPPTDLPEMPEGEESTDRPEMPEGEERERNNDNRPQGGGNMFQLTEGTVTFQITETTEILLGLFQGTETGTSEDIKEGSILILQLDAENNATKITINDFANGKDKRGQEESVTTN